MIRYMTKVLMARYGLVECSICGEWEDEYMSLGCIRNIWRQAIEEAAK